MLILIFLRWIPSVDMLALTSTSTALFPEFSDGYIYVPFSGSWTKAGYRSAFAMYVIAEPISHFRL